MQTTWVMKYAVLFNDWCHLQLFLLFLVHAHGGRLIELRPKPKLFLFGSWKLQWPCLIPWVLIEVAVSLGFFRNAAPGLLALKLNANSTQTACTAHADWMSSLVLQLVLLLVLQLVLLWVLAAV